VKYKCRYCKELIETEDLYQEPKKDRKGNVKLKPNGEPDTFKSHIKCFEIESKKISDWKELIVYIENKYFGVLSPKELCVHLKDLSRKVKFKDILGCLKSIEVNNNFASRMKEIIFDNDVQKGNYIFGAIRRNINTYVERKKNRELAKEVEDYELNNNIVELIDRDTIKTKTIKSENYDFLD
jgi:hypothetical protein